MSNLSQVTRKTIEKARVSKGWKVIFALALVPSLAVLSVPLGKEVAMANNQSADTNPDVTFTKWVTSTGTSPVLFNMAGLVSGEVGGGQFVGEVLELTSTTHTTKIKALYHINGGAHQFTARVNVTQDNDKGTAQINGVITDGWKKGTQVLGGYQVIAPCGIINAQNGPFGDTCFQGTLRFASGW